MTVFERQVTMNSTPNSAAAVANSPSLPPYRAETEVAVTVAVIKAAVAPLLSPPSPPWFIVPLSDEASASNSRPDSSCGLADWPGEMLRCWGAVN